jgi:hypothetical protein
MGRLTLAIDLFLSRLLKDSANADQLFRLVHLVRLVSLV